MYHSLSSMSLIDGGLYLSISLNNVLNFEDANGRKNIVIILTKYWLLKLSSIGTLIIASGHVCNCLLTEENARANRQWIM